VAAVWWCRLVSREHPVQFTWAVHLMNFIKHPVGPSLDLLQLEAWNTPPEERAKICTLSKVSEFTL